MAKIPPVHSKFLSKNGVTRNVYHDDDSCQKLARLTIDKRLPGTGDRVRCGNCKYLGS